MTSSRERVSAEAEGRRLPPHREATDGFRHPSQSISVLEQILGCLGGGFDRPETRDLFFSCRDVHLEARATAVGSTL